ncbi:MAG: LamB/YcsF family protein [Chloroflexota bacterium]|nr:LamB/YcsF family protein [Chloroflexota bacterium]
MPLITSANVACGAHAGDEGSMRAAVACAIANGVAVGAHPGYRDRANFGRVALDVPAAELTADLILQIDGLRAVARSLGAELAHVKAHGALYNTAQRDERVAAAIVEAMMRTAGDLVLFVFPGSAVERSAREAGLKMAREGFIDRVYEADGSLRARIHHDALITDPEVAAEQAVSFVQDGGVIARDGTRIEQTVDTLCVHGDTPGAAGILRVARAALVAAGVGIHRIA